MRKLLLLLLIAFTFNNCSAQKKYDQLKNISYYAAATNRWVSEIRLTDDSLFLRKIKATDTEDEDRYEIADEETRGDYFLVYAKALPFRPISNSKFPPHSQITRFNVFVFSFSKDKEKMFMLQLNKFYTSVADAKNANANGTFDDKFFSTWYSKTLFTAFTQYPDLIDADKATVQKVVDEWTADITQNANKLRNTLNVPYQEGIARILINNHLSPLGNLTDLDKKAREFQIRIPPVRLRSNNPPPSRFNPSESKNSRIIIDSPVGN